MLIVEDSKNKLISVISKKKIIQYTLGIYALWLLVKYNFTNTYILNISFVLMFILFIQETIDLDANFLEFMKIYYGNKVYLFLMGQMLLFNSFLLPIVVVLSINIYVYLSFSFVYGLIFVILKIIDVNAYTNALILLIFSNIIVLIFNISP